MTGWLAASSAQKRTREHIDCQKTYYVPILVLRLEYFGRKAQYQSTDADLMATWLLALSVGNFHLCHCKPQIAHVQHKSAVYVVPKQHNSQQLPRLMRKRCNKIDICEGLTLEWWRRCLDIPSIYTYNQNDCPGRLSLNHTSGRVLKPL